MPIISKERRNSDLERKIEKRQKQIWRKKVSDPDFYDSPHKSQHLYFTARWYSKRGILDSKMVSGLRKGKRMLSVGVGPGILEKTLLALSVPSENIDVTDVKLHPEIQKTKFRKFQFDMTKEWPDFKRKYDYIVFPESFCTGKLRKSSEMDKHFLRLALQNEEITSLKTSRAQRALEVIRNAAKNLNPDGQIKIAGLFLRHQELKWILSELEKQYPDMRPLILQYNSLIPNYYLALQFWNIPVRIRRKDKKE